MAAATQQQQAPLPLIDASTGPQSTSTKGTLISNNNNPDGSSDKAAAEAENDIADTATNNANDEPELRKIAAAEVSRHKTAKDMWIIIDNDVFDVTTFQHEHPGGSKILSTAAGRDATAKFDKYHRRPTLQRFKPRLQIGTIVVAAASDSPSPPEEEKKGKSLGGTRKLLGKLGIGRR